MPNNKQTLRIKMSDTLVTLIAILFIFCASHASATDLTSVNVKRGEILTVDVDSSSRKVVSPKVYKYKCNIFYAGNNPCRVLINCNSGKWKVLLLQESIDANGNVRGYKEIDKGWEYINIKDSELCN